MVPPIVRLQKITTAPSSIDFQPAHCAETALRPLAEFFVQARKLKPLYTKSSVKKE
jgi:hypothetical protein